MLNLNLWMRLSEEQYVALINIYGCEQALKFALSMKLDQFIKNETAPIRTEHITPDIEGEIA